MALGPLIREARASRGLGLRQLASLVGLSPGFLSLVERNLGAPPSEPKLRELAIVLGLDADMLILASGRVPADVTQAILNRPELIAQVRSHAEVSSQR